ncbi:MAG: RNA polymerase sigma factor [Phycisphaerae bacterium]
MNYDTTRKSLLLRVRDPGDQGAWYEFDACYRELILRYCRAKGLQAADAEDVRQIVMISLSSAMKNFQYQPERGRFRGYLGRVVSNAVARHRKRQSSAVPLEGEVLEGIAPIDDVSENDSDWEREWVNHHYRRAMQTLSATVEKSSIDAFEKLLAGASVEQVATEMNMAPQTVYKVRQRMRDRLQELVQEQIREEDDAWTSAS